jgi:short-subunit dehydrogenase
LTTVAPTRTVRHLFELSGYSAIITRGSVVLGRQMPEALAEMDANLVLCARNVPILMMHPHRR